MNEKFMREALALAVEAGEEGEVPIGCVVVRGDEVVGRGRNRREKDKNALAHAELEAINDACKNLGGWRLWQCDLYVTLEPCAMCAGAIVNSRVAHVYFGASDTRFGACGSVFTLFDYPLNHRPELSGGIMAEECAALLKDFFNKLRTKNSKMN